MVRPDSREIEGLRDIFDFRTPARTPTTLVVG
nr:hypothetical protein [uncultured archaeon]AQS29444.1 hypothetical protein [uncultured archaeon]AQS34072.1 hypothetical protein [uncultured archaeon]